MEAGDGAQNDPLACTLLRQLRKFGLVATHSSTLVLCCCSRRVTARALPAKRGEKPWICGDETCKAVTNPPWAKVNAQQAVTTAVNVRTYSIAHLNYLVKKTYLGLVQNNLMFSRICLAAGGPGYQGTLPVGSSVVDRSLRSIIPIHHNPKMG